MRRFERVATLVLLAGPLAACQGSPGQAGWFTPVADGGSGAAGRGAAADARVAEGSDGPTGEAPGVDLTGRWAMFQWEDPIAVDLVQDGNTLSGYGCGAGLPTALDPDEGGRDLCGPIAGAVVGRHATFAIQVLAFRYQFDVMASSDGRRMGGRLRTTTSTSWRSAFAWLRIEGDDRWLPDRAGPTLWAAFTARQGTIGLVPTGAAPTDLEPYDHPWLTMDDQRTGALVSGSLGSFAPRDMSWDEATQTLVLGPVPETWPTFPIKLSLAFDGATLLFAEATMPSGAVHLFTPSPL